MPEFRMNHYPTIISWCRRLAALLLLAPFFVQASEVRVAVAANFAQPMKDIAAVFQSDTGHKISMTPGATGKFYAQISNGAPFDVFLSADDETPRRLAAEGKAVPASQFTYAVGRLALWSPSDSLVDQAGAVLKSDRFQFLSIANPKVAPYGQAAVQVLQKLGLLDKVEKHFVLGESIAQAYQFVATGNAQLGFVALSQIFEQGKLKSGSAWIVPETLHEPLRQDVILLNAAKDSAAAQALLNYLKSDKARKIMSAYGYH
mgnify:CR=1 FL=1